MTEIKKFDVFKDTKEIKLVSFNASVGPPHLLGRLSLGDRFDAGDFLEVVTLSEGDSNGLLDVLVNYDFQIESIDRVNTTVLACYSPRNAVIFLDKETKVQGCLELCFECYGYQMLPTSMKIGRFCDEKFAVLKELFATAGIKSGLEPESRESEIDGQLATLESQLKNKPNNPILLRSIALLKLERGEYESATRDLDRSIRVDSNNWNGFFLRGKCRLYQRDYSGAIEDFDRVVDLNPDVSPAYLKRATAKIEQFRINGDERLKRGVCEDLKKAEELGEFEATDLLKDYCGSY